MNNYIPIVLGIKTSDTCNNRYRIPPWTIPLFSAPDDELQSLRGGKFGKDCHFLTMEWPRGNMEPALSRLGYQPHSYQVLSSFREPLSHFLSALSHINGVKWGRDKKAKENNQTYTEGKISLQDMVKINKNGNWYEYNLENFQSRFMYPPGFDELSAARIDEAINYMHKLYWFSVLSEVRLSLALLQCQVFGHVSPELLDKALTHGGMISQSKTEYSFTEFDMHDIGSLIKVDNKFYEAVIYEFWKRINSHQDCMANELNAWNNYDVTKKTDVVPVSMPRTGRKPSHLKLNSHRQLEGKGEEVLVTCEHYKCAW